MKKIIIHIGMLKTVTTTNQENILYKGNQIGFLCRAHKECEYYDYMKDN